MELGTKLDRILKAEIEAGNAIEARYQNPFADCEVLIVLEHPFIVLRDGMALVDGLEPFVNRDSHYPVGRGYVDRSKSAFVLAPLNS